MADRRAADRDAREQDGSATPDRPPRLPLRLLRGRAPSRVEGKGHAEAAGTSGEMANAASAGTEFAGAPFCGAQFSGAQFSGAWNMALDEVLLESLDSGQMCLRFYDWSPATLSLGYFQGLQEREQHEASRGCPVVRRASGGGAILHDQELTYSIVVPRGASSDLDHRWLYDRMHDSLLRTLRSFAIPARSCRNDSGACDADTRGTGPRTTGPCQSFLCFQRHCDGDLLLDAHKVVGSAQRRSQSAVLQHGSILLRRSRFAPELPGIEELAGVTLEPSRLIERWLDVLSDEAGWDVCEGQVSGEEEAAALVKVKEKFGSADWTSRR